MSLFLIVLPNNPSNKTVLILMLIKHMLPIFSSDFHSKFGKALHYGRTKDLVPRYKAPRHEIGF